MKLASSNNKNVDIIQVFLADESSKSVRVDSYTTVQKIIDVVLNGLGIDSLSHCRFALRLTPFVGLNSNEKLPNKGRKNSVPLNDPEECHWLHSSFRIPQLRKRYIEMVPTEVQLRFELRIRFISNDLHEMYQTEMAAFLYLYEQLMADYVKHVAWRIDSYKAFEIAALAIRKRFPNLTNETLEKRLDFGAIEREGGLIKYLPESFIIDTKKKVLQKQIVTAVRRIISFSELECVFRFMKILADLTPFDVEVFHACLGVGWHSASAVDVHVGQELGLSYFTENSKAPISLTLLQNITNLTIQPLPTNSHVTTTSTNNKGPQVVRLKISATSTQLIFTLPTLNISESFAHLIEGYHRMLASGSEGVGGTIQNDVYTSNNFYNSTIPTNKASSIWRFEPDERPISPQMMSSNNVIPVLRSPTLQRKEIKMENLAKRRVNKSPMNLIFHNNDLISNNNNNISSPVCRSAPSTPRLHSRSIPIINKTKDAEFEEGDYAYPMLRNLHIDMRLIRLEEFLGEGQFGNVYKGIYDDNFKPAICVAVKVCKTENDFCDTNTSNKYLLDEARTMAQFRHPHIVKLMGICRNLQTVWIIMELASEGELRAYLHRERHSPALDLSVQILFAHQLASALTYLHSRQFLHRDVAARNCLVANPRCVKISDFGLSRQIVSDEEIYTASQGKLPIKWLPPESINFRKFSFSSDVYMFGICIWEILTFGIKPWQGIRNHEVVQRVEMGELLPQPLDCPDSVYALLKIMWRTEPKSRCTMQEAKNFLADFLDQIDRKIPYHKIQLLPFYNMDNNHRFTENQNCNLALKVDDTSEVVPSTLWRAIEQQRAQCDADEKWLEQLAINNNNLNENENFHPSSSSRPFKSPLTVPKSSKHDESNMDGFKEANSLPIPPNMELDRNDDEIYDAVIAVVRAVSQLSQSYASQMMPRDFLTLVEEIKSEARELFHKTEGCISRLKEKEHKQVTLMRTLCNADLRKINQAMEKIYESEGEMKSRSSDFERREVLKLTHVLAVNCKNFLDSIDLARIRSGIAKFRPKK